MKKVSILVIDDDTGMTETMKDILDEHGMEVAIANDGYYAINLVNERSFDIILSDIKMPGINGVETLKEIKKIRPNIRVIMMTAYTSDELVEEAKEEGAYKVVFKPLPVGELINVIGEIIIQNDLKD